MTHNPDGCGMCKMRAELAELRAKVARVEALTYATDDGTEYEHDHDAIDGYPECPACWAHTIRAALEDHP